MQISKNNYVLIVNFAQPCLTLYNPMYCIVQSMEFSRQEYQSAQPFTSPEDLPNPGIKPRAPTLQADSLPAEPPGKPKDIGVGSLSLLQGIILTQELNQGLLHCRWILYHYQGSPSRYHYICAWESDISSQLCSNLVSQIIQLDGQVNG